MRFTVRRPPCGEVSPCGHRPSGGDIACGVDVGVAPASSTGFALENRLALTIPRSGVPAHRASLRRIGCQNLLDPSVSLVLQTCGEKPPTAAADCPVKPTLLSYTHTWMLDSAAGRPCHRPHVECFDSDRVEPPRNVSGSFLNPVLAPVDLTRLQIRDRQSCSHTPVGTVLCPRQPLLQHLQTLRLTSAQTGGMQQLAGRQRRRDNNAPVDTHHLAVTRRLDRLGPARSRVTRKDLTPAGTGRERRNRTQPTLGTHTRAKRRLSCST